ncbi:hypothetical protein M0802_012621 [Mischocyttarus mexicanus]|nr:hypothetical protein M0802_012621 [Mischocyttarus mexicanus]
MKNELLHIITAYAPDVVTSLKNFKSFCKQLQNEAYIILTKEMTIMRNMNARIENDIIEGEKKQFNENVTNNCGQIMTGLYAHNKPSINNTFF